jgi:hypothetical protein
VKRPTVWVRFESVGRGKKSWDAEVAQDPSFPGTPDMDSLFDALRRGRALVSQDIDVSCDDESGLNGGCFAGGRPVGTWRVVVRPAERAKGASRG